MRRALGVLVISGVVGLLACSDAVPCSSCPPVDGTYAVAWADGGVTLACPGPRMSSWVLTQHGAQVVTRFGDVDVAGTLYDSFDLVMSGGLTPVSYRLRALAIPQPSAFDAGMTLEGTLTTSQPSADGGDPCTSTETFTAQRTSR